ncbi:viral A-type inclusion protein [Leptotrichia sp. OH3620_COT-345]|uniref:viral A-type inclusion protein n=1 Tax=Leptotrichia sp. OH3620_COT-345 TaxID=2491048 RepID=UPI000F650D3B|nr:viral A-type inclusion protein [Leptotrichia sp. OH3620_COT-345]RRD39539.1 viral A-type inclusion protein [Leptotrichia sp. OH3620_COT-345]
MKKLKLTDEEKEILKGNEEGIKQAFINKAALAAAEKNEFSEQEKEELDYFYNNEKTKYFVAKQIEDKISVDADEVVKIYNENKAQFDAQNVPFSQARDIIQRDLLNQQVATLENEEFNKIVQEMGETVEITKKEILFSQGNPDVIRNIILNKIVTEKAKENDFEKKEKNSLKIIKDNVLLNYYIDLEVRKKVQVTHEEIVNIYEAEKGKLGNVTPNDAYNQIANGLLNNKANEERTNVINKIVEEYKIDDLVKENL